jgi:3-oxoadipate enol-lactonase
MPFADINGFRMHYRDEGVGFPVLFGHGLMGSVAQQEALFEDLAPLRAAHRVVTYDARGHGLSGHTADPADYAWAALANDMHALMAHLGIARAHIGGASMGAGTSLMLALAHPEAVASLVAVLPPPFGDDLAGPQAMFLLLASAIEGLGLNAAVELVARLPQMQELKASAPRRYALFRDGFLALNPVGIVAAIRGLFGGAQIPIARFGEIAAPALIVAHDGDPIHPLSSARRLADALPNARLWVAPRPNYLQEHPEAAVGLIGEFLAA